MTGPFKMKGWSGYQNSPAKQLKPEHMSEEDIHRMNINVHGQPEKGSVKESEWIKEGKLTKDGKKVIGPAGPAKQNDKTKIAEANEESKAQNAKAENEGQQIIGKVDRGEISQEEGNKQLAALQDAQ
mgnify:FL=1